MTELLCRNRVRDFGEWLRIFTGHAAAHRAAGLTLKGLWREDSDPLNVFFLFSVEDRRRAEAFLAAPDAAEAGAAAGVVDGEYHFLEPAGGGPLP